ncbi:MAG: extracellular solute-binding protein [Candidatus Paceibacterota bacterium]|jgi:ABC-type glycerol-3-phosphate transport system substrate-binding protein
MTRFQIIFTAILVFFAVAGAALFSFVKNDGSSQAPTLSMWGDIDKAVMSRFLADISLDYPDQVNVDYVQKDRVRLEPDLIEALARGSGPDLILLPQDLIVKELDKFYQIPFDTYSKRVFQDSFIEEGEMYFTPTGIVGLPFSIDPLVMYWNRDIFATAGSAKPPATWTDFAALVPKVTKKDSGGSITQSLVSFGEVRNVDHAKDIISLLAMQAGTPIIAWNANGSLKSVLSAGGGSLVPGEEAVRFFTEFSNPVKSLYSWNRSLPTAKNSFVSGRLALYFGYASELPGLRAANPNLNFDIAAVPQAGGRTMTYGKMRAIALLKASPNISAAYTAATTLTSAPVIARWIAKSNLPPVRRDLLSAVPGDAYKAVFYQGALTAKAWLDPNKDVSDVIFMKLVEDVTSGKSRISEAVRTASLELDNLLR